MRYAGRPLLVGDEFEASAKDARLLKAIGKAEDALIGVEVRLEPDSDASIPVSTSSGATVRRGRPRKVKEVDGAPADADEQDVVESASLDATDGEAAEE
jgi:hypothetical protein